MNANARIYVACLASYNNGVLYGQWIDLDDADTVREHIAAMLRGSRFPNVTVPCPYCIGEDLATDGASPCTHCGGAGHVSSAEEWAVHDYDLPHGIKTQGEHPDPDALCELVELVEEHGDAFAKWVEYGHDVDADAFRDAYVGEFNSVHQWAEQWLDETCHFENVPDHIRNYFDFEAWARDAVMGGDFWTVDGSEGVHVFHNV